MKALKLAKVPKLGGFSAPLKAPKPASAPKEPKADASKMKVPKAPKASSLIAIILKQKIPKYKGLDTGHFTKKK